MRDDEITDILTDAYSTLEMLGQDLAATQHRVYYSYDEKVDYEALEVWKRDLRGVQRRIDEVFKLLESK
jgi:hypothetical protein